MKITVDLDADLYRALKVEAARADRSLRDVIAEALAAWLERAEDEEDRASAEQALVEYRRDGGVAAAEFFERLAAETRAAYGSDDPPDRA
jgi:Arc/MetJ-type ribon-helix-helix transcriptional regulator